MDYIFLVFLVQGVLCTNTSQWTAESRHRADTVGGFWNSSSSTLTECVYMCLQSHGCEAVATKPSTKPRRRLCVFLKHLSLQDKRTIFLNRTSDPEPTPGDFLLYVPRHVITILSKIPLSTDINKVQTSTNKHSFDGLSPEGHPGAQGINTKQYSTITSNPLDSLANKKRLGKEEQDLKIGLSGFAVIEQYNHRSKGRALHALDVETWTFLQHRMDVKGEIIKVVFDLKKNVIYRVESDRSSSDYKLKSTSLKTLVESRLFDLSSRNVDINVQDNGLYMMFEGRRGSILVKKELVGTGKNEKTVFTFPQEANVDNMQSFRVDSIRSKVYWSISSRGKVIVYKADYSSETKPVHIVLKTRSAYLYPSTELYFADDRGVLSVWDIKRNIPKRVATCGFQVKSVSTVGRYNGYWCLTCYRKNETKIHIYDDEMKLLKELKVTFKGIVASE